LNSYVFIYFSLLIALIRVSGSRPEQANSRGQLHLVPDVSGTMSKASAFLFILGGLFSLVLVFSFYFLLLLLF
jgi:hypothetical protein